MFNTILLKYFFDFVNLQWFLFKRPILKRKHNKNNNKIIKMLPLQLIYTAVEYIHNFRG